MVHADSSTFADGLSKGEAYRQVMEQTQALVEGQRNWVCNLANAASLLWHAYKSLQKPLARVNWAGFYVLDPLVDGQLLLGPFQGKVACQTISFGRGVCGTAALTGLTQLVPDVHAYPGHIACDGQSASEIVVPVLLKDKVVAIIDIDCADADAFDHEDQTALEELAVLLASSCDW